MFDDLINKLEKLQQDLQNIPLKIEKEDPETFANNFVRSEDRFFKSKEEAEEFEKNSEEEKRKYYSTLNKIRDAIRDFDS